MKTLYFAYGSNMNQEQMSTRCRGSELGSLARLTGWRYFINGRGYAGIEESPSDHVLGCLWSLEDEHAASLDRYEGVKEIFIQRKPSKSRNRRMDRKYPPSFTSRSTWNTEFPLPVIRAWWSRGLEKSDCPPIT